MLTVRITSCLPDTLVCNFLRIAIILVVVVLKESNTHVELLH